MSNDADGWPEKESEVPCRECHLCYNEEDDFHFVKEREKATTIIACGSIRRVMSHPHIWAVSIHECAPRRAVGGGAADGWTDG